MGRDPNNIALHPENLPVNGRLPKSMLNDMHNAEVKRGPPPGTKPIRERRNSMNFNEALRVLRRINVHHGNAPISDAQAQCFYEELSRSVSFDEANAAVREFYALHPSRRMDDGGGYQPRREKETTAVDAIGGDHHPADGGEPDFRPRRDVAVPTLSAQIIGPWPSRHAGGAGALELSRHPMLGGPRDGATKKPAADTAGETPIHAIRPRSRPSSKASSADSSATASGGIDPPDIGRTSNQKRHQKNRLEKKQMADITTQTIRDTRPWTTFENVTREEGRSSGTMAGRGSAKGMNRTCRHLRSDSSTHRAEVDEFDYGEPDLEDEQLTEDQKRDMLDCA